MQSKIFSEFVIVILCCQKKNICELQLADIWGFWSGENKIGSSSSELILQSSGYDRVGVDTNK